MFSQNFQSTDWWTPIDFIPISSFFDLQWTWTCSFLSISLARFITKAPPENLQFFATTDNMTPKNVATKMKNFVMVILFSNWRFNYCLKNGGICLNKLISYSTMNQFEMFMKINYRYEKCTTKSGYNATQPFISRNACNQLNKY